MLSMILSNKYVFTQNINVYLSGFRDEILEIEKTENNIIKEI